MSLDTIMSHVRLKLNYTGSLTISIAISTAIAATMLQL